MRQQITLAAALGSSPLICSSADGRLRGDGCLRGVYERYIGASPSIITDNSRFSTIHSQRDEEVQECLTCFFVLKRQLFVDVQFNLEGECLSPY